MLTSHNSRDCKYEIRVSPGLSFGKHLPGLPMGISSPCAHMVESKSKTDGQRQSVRSLGSPLVRAHTIGSGPYLYDLIYFNLNYPLRGASPNAVTLRIRALKYEFGEGGHNHSVRNTYKIDIYFHVHMIAFVYLLPFIVFTVLFSLYFLKL